jgi:uncharacterized repeat protein (TIGR03943 family)
MNERASAACRAALLLASAGVIAKLLATGQMMKYITPTLDPLTALTGVVFAVMGVVEGSRALRSRPGRRADDHQTRHVLAQDEEHGHGADGGLERTLEHALTYVFVLLPLALGFFVTPRALGSSALGGERVTGLLLAYASGSAPDSPRGEPGEPLHDVGPLLAYLRKVGDAGIGRPVRVTGMAVQSDALGAGEFALLRYLIAHCVADARPLALLIVATAVPDVGPDQWVEVEGEVSSRQRNGDRLVSIVARRITPVDEPRNPYLAAAY